MDQGQPPRAPDGPRTPLHLCLALGQGGSVPGEPRSGLGRAAKPAGEAGLPAGLAPWLAAFVAASVAAAQADGELLFSLRQPGAAALQPDQPPVDIWLLLDPALLPTLPVADGSRCWLVCDGQDRLLAADWPMLDSITRGRGLSLQLLAWWPAAAHGAAVSQAASLRSGAPPTTPLGTWRQLRSAHWAANPRYELAQQHLPAALQLVLRQAVTDLRLGVLTAEHAVRSPRPAPSWGGARSRVARWRGRLLAACAVQRARWLSEYWRIGIVDAPIGAWVQAGGRLPVRWITPAQADGYWADPMGMVGDPHQLFCEYFDQASGTGHLEALTLNDDGQVAKRRRLSVGDGAHVSFPLVVELDGRRLGVAEASATRECLLYEVDAEGAWRPVGTLLSGVSAADPALFAWEGRYWLAFTDLDIGAMDNLCLYHADRLEGPWLPHANNPVKLDITGARMAGGVFQADGRTYRPAQDCLNSYGAALTLHQILRCTPTEYEEARVAHIGPDPLSPCPDGLHTLSAWGDRTLIDGKRMGFNLPATWRKLRERVARRGAAPRAPGVGVQRMAVYIPHLRTGGGEMSLLRLAGGLARAGVAVDLVVHTMATAELSVPPGVQLLCLDTHSTLGAVRRLARLLRERQPECLLSGFPHTNLAAVAAVALAGVGCRCVVSEHAPLSQQIERQGNWRYRLLPPLVRWAYRRADAVVAVSEGVRDDLQRLIGPGLRLRVIANPVLAEPDPMALAAQPLHPWLQDPALRVVLSVSRLSVEKDIATLLRAFAQLHAGQPETRLLLVGDGPERAQLLAQAQAMGLAEQVQLPGRVALPMAWMARAAVFALASQYEGFGNVLVEALASGVPVVSTDCPVGPREILVNGRFGALVPVGDDRAMAAALAAALRDGQPAGAQAHALQFTEARACAAYQQLFDDLLQGAPC